MVSLRRVRAFLGATGLSAALYLLFSAAIGALLMVNRLAGHAFTYLWGLLDIPWFDHRIDHLRGPENWHWHERGVLAQRVMKPGGRVLDLCCGDGIYSGLVYAPHAAQVDAVDRDGLALAMARWRFRRPNLRFLRRDIVHDELPAATYDTVCWFEAIEHFSVEAGHRVLAKVARALAPTGGVLIGSTSIFAHAGGHNDEHDNEFLTVEQLQAFLAPHFAQVEIRTSPWPDRTAAYFECREPRAAAPAADAEAQLRTYYRTCAPYYEHLDRAHGEVYFADVVDALAAHAGALDRLSVLDVCSGTGALARQLERRGVPREHLTATDLSELGLARTPHARRVQSDAQALPFATGAFDAVVMTDGLEHVALPAQALAECLRVTRPGGVLVVRTQNYAFPLSTPRDWTRTAGAVLHGLGLSGADLSEVDRLSPDFSNPLLVGDADALTAITAHQLERTLARLPGRVERLESWGGLWGRAPWLKALNHLPVLRYLGGSCLAVIRRS